MPGDDRHAIQLAKTPVAGILPRGRVNADRVVRRLGQMDKSPAVHSYRALVPMISASNAVPRGLFGAPHVSEADADWFAGQNLGSH